MISNDYGSGLYSFHGQERFGVYKRITASKTGWRIAMAAPLDESPLATMENGLFLASLVFLAAGAVVSVFASGIVARPFQKIETQNQHLEQLNATVQAQAVQIQDEHERAMLLLDAMPLACRLWNREFKIFACNDATVKLFNVRDQQEYMERHFEFSPEYQPDGQSSREKTLQMLNKVFTEGKYTFEWMHQLPDGTPLPVEITLVRVKYGDDYVIAGYTRDLREHKQMIAKIREAHERTKLLLDATPLAAHLWDKNHILFDCNEQSVKLFGMKDKQEYLERFYELFPTYQPNGQLSSEIASKHIKEAFENGRKTFEWTYQMVDGTLMPSEVTLVRLKYGDDYVVAGYARDLREHKKT